MFRIDANSDVPVFQQIVDGVKSAIARGACRPGEAIPSVRGMAAEVLVNPNTVAKAYRDLEREGVIQTQRGKGLFVSPDAPELCREDRRNTVLRKLNALIAEAQAAGIPASELAKAIGEERASDHEQTEPE
ncbi:MAG: GntR family transcriptional regulator [Lentisphaerae bacterium]|jgi:GntR family transcriptional regulator|nr:GntR family transcriptional regulator [Lentisphaerota bacterium]MBT4819454.1 GntR family transcriptional regulator [Lentisphaerota bacterium]MBT5612057.1 GntR family transcriptional regulator [Lentisphaerota bacterium]MBT7056901.1 GntR family transcriptional regulator [Lentisphaerota bacterium]MBT7842048.1 GntR family transcriptional regulator [Lentisphaerota bacterium]